MNSMSSANSYNNSYMMLREINKLIKNKLGSFFKESQGAIPKI
jgi:hypothetical protein